MQRNDLLSDEAPHCQETPSPEREFINLIFLSLMAIEYKKNTSLPVEG